MALFRKTEKGLEIVEPTKNSERKKLLGKMKRINKTRFNLDEYKLTEEERGKIEDDLGKREEEILNKLDNIEG